MNADAFIKGRLAAYALQQGLRHGGIANSFAVAHVVANRVHAGWFGGNWMQVIEAATESEGNDYSGDPTPVDLQKIIIKRFLEKVDDIYGGQEPDLFSGGQALYFCDMTGVVTPWFVEHIIRQPEHHTRCATVGVVSLFS